MHNLPQLSDNGGYRVFLEIKKSPVGDSFRIRFLASDEQSANPTELRSVGEINLAHWEVKELAALLNNA